ncbi:hypothetical protein GJ496_008726 [Pomphorhynchus laevis]|nr:hypothetical protein GJ496_008726 [Pomphorhynchus laevis]
MTEWKIDMGESFEDAIDSKAICLSEICNEIGLKAISIKRAYEFYSLFVSTFHSKKPETVMDALLYLIEHGNTTVYEMKHHVAPASLCRPQVNLKNEHKSAIDEEGCIDWGDNIEETDKNQCYEAMNSDALTILEFKNTREQIFQAVCQIFAFFKQRLISSVDVDYDYITDQVVHDYLEMLSNNEAVENMFNDVKWLYDQLSGQEFIRLCSIWDSPKKLQITNDLIVKRISDIRTLEEQERMLQLELHNLIESDDNLKSDLNRLLKQLKSLKEKICSAIEETSSQNIKVSLAGCGQLQDSN